MGVTRDGVWLHLSSFPGDGVGGGVVYIIVDDVDRLYAQFAAKGVAVGLEPTDQTWDNREMDIEDPDGYSVRFVRESGGGGGLCRRNLCRALGNVPRGGHAHCTDRTACCETQS